MADYKVEVIQKLGVISETKAGWTKEVRLISWNGNEPKYDIRDWSADDKIVGKGIVLSQEEVKELRNILNSIDL